MKSNIKFSGRFFVECYDKDGNLKWKDDIINNVMNIAIDDIFDVYFNNGTPTATFFVALIRDDNFSAISSADTAASHAGWEEGDEYNEATRPAWVIVAPASQTVTNAASLAEFNINDTEIIKGAAIYTNNVKLGTTGVLISAGLFTGGDKDVVANDVLRVTYEITGSG